jgi:integrase
MEPERDWAWIRRHPLRPRSAEAMASRKPVTPFDPGKLAALLFETCRAIAPKPVNHATAQQFRDAVLVLLALYLGLRSANLALLRIGVHVSEVGETYRIDLAPEETKAGKPVSSMVPAPLAVLLRTYVDRYRPVLGEGKPPTDFLWINRDGDPLNPYAIYGVFRRVGREAGIELRPHLVRHTLATTLMSVAPTNLGLAAAALTHRGARMVNEVYDRSGTEASHAMWRRLRRGLMRS